MSAPEEVDPTTTVQPRPGLRERIASLILLARRQRWASVTAVGLLMLLIGIPIGRATAPDPMSEARAAIEATVLPLALDADGIWTSSSETRAAVSEALAALRQGDDPTLVEQNADAWLEAYDAALVRIAGVDLPSTARPVQRQLIAAVTSSRDAVEVLVHAASVNDELLRRDLTTEVGRLRSRSEQLTQSARASMSDLDGSRTDLAPLPELRSFFEGRRG